MSDDRDQAVYRHPSSDICHLSSVIWKGTARREILMPRLGETVAEGKITTWFKSVGDAVKPGDNLFEIETDKVSMEVPSITTGTLTEIKVQAGAVALVGAVVAIIAGDGGAAAPAPAAAMP